MLTSLRSYELASLKLSNLTRVGARCFIEGRIKGGKIHRQELPARALAAIERAWVARLTRPDETPAAWGRRTDGARRLDQLPPHTRLFGVASAQAVAKVVKDAARRAGLRATPHTLRHSFALWRDELGQSPREIAAIMGHESTTYTERYLKRLRRPDDPMGDVAAEEIGL
jgi:integrase